MNKPKKLNVGDKVAIVSLSRGILGEPFAAHEIVIGNKRLEEFGLIPVYMPNAKKGIKYLHDHPEARAADLKQAFLDPSIKGVFCAIGGDDTINTIPYLLDDTEFISCVKDNPKVFLGFSDSTNNHLMFYTLGLQTYYGQSFLIDFAELADDMLPYTKEWSRELLHPSPQKEIESSAVWYDDRTDFGTDQVGVARVSHKETRGFEVLSGKGILEGRLLGGCIESLYEMLVGARFPKQVEITKKYGLFPSTEEWKDKILFVETSEERPNPEKMEKILTTLDEAGVFDAVKAVLVGKPQDEQFYEEYKEAWLTVASRKNLPIIYNMNFGHAAPRCILPYGGLVKVDFDQAKVYLLEPLVS
ncbi:MAG TPA: LD-carboxypeptidase [Candidatus Saccharibacteria bacterium]|jgi:muramoyltetrapeptide carboxypeptidase LdcA involved in peptidoglycan recycling|nr:LD-carboxypeptidase [Candidatus Saccharibacteria bacterium]HMT55280.1 LD-carboxypeptidase [Candidatus Saccharibacteria bacterium]